MADTIIHPEEDQHAGLVIPIIALFSSQPKDPKSALAE